MSASGVPTARAVCVVRDPGLRRALQRSLCGNGTRVEFRESVHEGAIAPDAILFIDDQGRRNAEELSSLTRLIGERGRIVMLGGSLGDRDLVALLREHALDHVISDRATPDEQELAVTSAKLHSGDIFGLEKYLAWGVEVSEVEVSTYDDKCEALDELGLAAQRMGARGRLTNRIQSTADELLMNALYDAPAASGARPPQKSAPHRLHLPGAPGALLRFASDGRYMAVSVLDPFGALDKRAVFDAVLRAQSELGRPRAEGGAGLGLYFVLSTVTRFIVNIQPGRLTEVICLFDLRERGRDAAGWARSLHVFTAA